MSAGFVANITDFDGWWYRNWWYELSCERGWQKSSQGHYQPMLCPESNCLPAVVLLKKSWTPLGETNHFHEEGHRRESRQGLHFHCIILPLSVSSYKADSMKP